MHRDIQLTGYSAFYNIQTTVLYLAGYRIMTSLIAGGIFSWIFLNADALIFIVENRYDQGDSVN